MFKRGLVKRLAIKYLIKRDVDLEEYFSKRGIDIEKYNKFFKISFPRSSNARNIYLKVGLLGKLDKIGAPDTSSEIKEIKEDDLCKELEDSEDIKKCSDERENDRKYTTR